MWGNIDLRHATHLHNVSIAPHDVVVFLDVGIASNWKRDVFLDVGTTCYYAEQWPGVRGGAL